MRSDRERLRMAVAANNGASPKSYPRPGAVAVLAHDERSRQGSAEITGWCPRCEERAIPMRDGTCGFCQTQLVDLGTTSADGGSSEKPCLRLGDDLMLPLDAATQSLAILAVKGAGKSNAAAVLAEEFFDEGIPWVVIDPKGDWWGIREAVGDSNGLPVLVLGGLHGDLSLSPSSATAVAELIVDRNLTCVLDVSSMDDEERPEFLATFGEALFALHHRSPSVRHIIVEEAQEVVPEGGGKPMRPTIRAWTRIVCQGRQRGLGITLVSQRSALVSKNVLTQTGSLIVLRTTSPQDRDVIKKWTDFHSVSKELVASLPGLANGEAWIVAPSWLGRVGRCHIRRRWTFDSGATPTVLSTRRSQDIAALDVEAIARALNGEPDTESPEPDEQPPSVEHGTMTEPEGATVPVAAVAIAERAVEHHHEQEMALDELDDVLLAVRDDGGLTMLRARYLAALLVHIERGDLDPGLLDRFERVAGFAA